MKSAYLDKFEKKLEKFQGSLVKVKSIKKIEKNAKEYLNKLSKLGKIEKVCWGWYYIPDKSKDVWDFLRKDKNFKIIIKQTAASFWNYDFVHRNIVHLAVKNKSYKKALEEFGKKRGWIFEIEQFNDVKKRFNYIESDGLLIESPESCLVNCISDWSFLDAFSVLYFRKDEISLDILKKLGMWKRISRTNIRVWNVLGYGCKLFNESFGNRVFDIRTKNLARNDMKELVEESIEKVVEFV